MRPERAAKTAAEVRIAVQAFNAFGVSSTLPTPAVEPRAAEQREMRGGEDRMGAKYSDAAGFTDACPTPKLHECKMQPGRASKTAAEVRLAAQSVNSKAGRSSSRASGRAITAERSVADRVKCGAEDNINSQGSRVGTGGRSRGGFKSGPQLSMHASMADSEEKGCSTGEQVLRQKARRVSSQTDLQRAIRASLDDFRGAHESKPPDGCSRAGKSEDGTCGAGAGQHAYIAGKGPACTRMKRQTQNARTSASAKSSKEHAQASFTCFTRS